MKPPPFSYHTPQSVAEAVALLGSLDNAQLLAGGQSLMPMLNMRYAQPDHLIDLACVAGLDRIKVRDGGLEIGAMVRQRTVEFSEDVRRLCPLLAEAIRFVGHRQTRNRGTVGGSLAHCDSAAEIPTVCAALEATIRVEGPSGRREIPFREFPVGYLMSSLAPDEVLVSLYLPVWVAGHGHGFEEFARRHGDFAIVSAAALIEADKDGRIAHAALAIGGAGAAPVRIDAVENELFGKAGGRESFAAAADLCSGIEAYDDIHASGEYRRRLARVLALRALDKAWSRAVGGPA
jgi:carbon-monoxide dehydrogenase medium subunit